MPGLNDSAQSNSDPGFLLERRKNFINATKLDRKSGGAEWRDLLFNGIVAEFGEVR
jgi:hypothetical protein